MGSAGSACLGGTRCLRYERRWERMACPLAEREARGNLAVNLPSVEQKPRDEILGLEGVDPRPQNSPRGDRDNSDDEQLKMSALPRGNYGYI
ncbi:hypothetical protein Anapl_15245 [Anas platyrhynchos]|uniref:Uncharacterized protein n=1 Tax=Anas platyrhynchos TaxID=8839 RepID=R0JIQ6_ANAPL|nr:hypothetical protein Anapl_15245 [Anas platyrhynchos]